MKPSNITDITTDQLKCICEAYSELKKRAVAFYDQVEKDYDDMDVPYSLQDKATDVDEKMDKILHGFWCKLKKLEDSE